MLVDLPFWGILLQVIGGIIATRRVVASLEGAAVPAWLAFIWLSPCIGIILALVYVKKKPPTSIQIDPAKSE